MNGKRKMISVSKETYERLDNYRNSFYGQYSFEKILNQMLNDLGSK